VTQPNGEPGPSPAQTDGPSPKDLVLNTVAQTQTLKRTGRTHCDPVGGQTNDPVGLMTQLLKVIINDSIEADLID